MLSDFGNAGGSNICCYWSVHCKFALMQKLGSFMPWHCKSILRQVNFQSLKCDVAKTLEVQGEISVKVVFIESQAMSPLPSLHQCHLQRWSFSWTLSCWDHIYSLRINKWAQNFFCLEALQKCVSLSRSWIRLVTWQQILAHNYCIQRSFFAFIPKSSDQ